MLSRELATSLNVRVAPGKRVKFAPEVRGFAQKFGYPVMVKALDGGGGRGIRAVHGNDGIEDAFKRYYLVHYGLSLS